MRRRPRPDRVGGATTGTNTDSSTADRTPVTPADPLPTPANPLIVHRRLRLEDIVHKLTWDLDDISALTGLSRRWLEGAIASGRMRQPDIRCGRRCLWRPETIREWIEGGCSNGRP
jgi:hypothetical protein